MKLTEFFLLVAATAAAISCTKEILPENDGNPAQEVELIPMTFTASYDDGSETKAAYEEGATVWKANDKIMVITEAGLATEFTATSVDGKKATFEGLTENSETYYAVYPASAYEGEASDVTAAEGGKLIVRVPETQRAVAGTFDPDALLCIANTKGNELYFKHSCAVLKFQLADPEGVKSVRLAVNGSDNVAGTGYVGVNATDMNPKYATSDPKQSKYDMITLNAPEGGFVAGESYFITMRANSCPDGITVYIEYEDAVRSRTSSNKVFTDGSISRIKNLGQLDKNLTDITPYDSYQLGFDIVIGNKVYNKDTYTFELITASKENDPAIRSKIHSKEGQFYLFLDSGNYNFELGSYTTILGDVVMIGNDLNNPAKVSFTQVSRINSGSITMSNLDITPMSGNRTLETTYATSDISYILFDKCTINNLNNNFVYVNNINYKVTDIQFSNCNISIYGGSAVLVKGYNTNTYDNISFVNNLIYNPGDLNSDFKLFCDNKTKSSTISKCSVDSNTFINTYANTTYLVYVNECSDITITDNLIYFPNEISKGTGYLRAMTTYPSVYNISNNIAFSTSTQAIRYFFDNTILSSNTNTITDGTNPFSTYNLSSGVFVKNALYDSYGATR